MKRAFITSIAVLSISFGVAGSVATVSEAHNKGGGGDNNNNNQCENGHPTPNACNDNHNDNHNDDHNNGNHNNGNNGGNH